MGYSIHVWSNSCLTFGTWFNGLKGLTGLTIVVGMSCNVVFGFIDNAGLFFGASFLDEIFEKLPGGSDANVCAGQGNTFSDFLGAFLGTFVGNMVADLVGFADGPLWSNCIGIVIGCLIGIAVPKAILRNSENMGINKVTTRNALMGNMDKDELNSIVNEDMSMFDFRTQKIFKRMDIDNSNTLDKGEIKNYMEKTMGDQFDEKEFQMNLSSDWAHDEDGDADTFTLEEFRKIQKDMAIKMWEEKYGKTKKWGEETKKEKDKDVELVNL